MAKFKTYNDIVNHYNNFKLYRNKVEAYYQKSNVDALVKGYSTYYKGCMNVNHQTTVVSPQDLVMPANHQHWITKRPNYAQKVEQIILNNKLLSFKGDFEALYAKLVKLNVTSADLYRYDLCLRIGQCNGIFPNKKVYLHKGALKGAKELERLQKIKLPKTCTPCVDISVFAKIFPNSSAKDIEDILCIYKRSFHTIKP